MANLPHLRPRHAKLPPTLDAFRHRGFQLLWPANFFSYISRWMQMTLLVWLVLEETGSPFLVALVGFFGMIPLLLFGAIGGVLADRIDRRKLLRSTQLLNLAAGLFMLFMLCFRHGRGLARLHCCLRQVVWDGHSTCLLDVQLCSTSLDALV